MHPAKGPDDRAPDRSRFGGPGERPQADVDLVGRYVALVTKGILSVDAEALGPVANPASVMHAAGYDWTAPGAWEAVRDLWRPHMPSGLHGATPIDVAALVGVVEGVSDAWCLPEALGPACLGASGPTPGTSETDDVSPLP